MTCVDKTLREEGKLYCELLQKKYSCWPTTKAGHYAVVPCPAAGGADTSKNASLYCTTNGTWHTRANYSSCFDIKPKQEVISNLGTILYDVGFGLSTVALVIALFIFLYFRSLRCLRNRIHCHLIVTFIIKNVVFFIIWSTATDTNYIVQYPWACKLITSLGNYTQVTNFFWMLVEGLYLHIIIVWTYTADRMRLWYFVVIGWGIPAIIIISWAIVRVYNDPNTISASIQCWHSKTRSSQYRYLENLDYIYTVPIYVVLVVNTLILISIIKVLVTKLRASHTMETDQIRKSVKATLLLFPILGLTYMVFVWSPEEPTAVKAQRLTNAFLEPFQGFFVALLYCFLNREVRTVLRKRVKRIRESRSLSSGTVRSSIGWANDHTRKESLAAELATSPKEREKNLHRNGVNGKAKNLEETENMLHHPA